MKFFELRLVDGAGSAQHQVLVALSFRKRDDVADVLSAREHHHDAVDPRSNTAVRWNPILEGIEKMTEALADRFR